MVDVSGEYISACVQCLESPISTALLAAIRVTLPPLRGFAVHSRVVNPSSVCTSIPIRTCGGTEEIASKDEEQL